MLAHDTIKTKGKTIAPVITNFMCQLDWVSGCPDIYSDFILGVSESIFG